MEVVLLIFFAVVLGTLLNMAMKKPQQPPPPPPDTVTVINNAIEQRTETLKAEMLYKWETEGDTHRLIFRPTQAALKWNYGFTCRRVESSSNPISKGGQIANIIIESAWAQLIGVNVPQPIAPAEGVVKLSDRWGFLPLPITDGEFMISIEPPQIITTPESSTSVPALQSQSLFDNITPDMLYLWEAKDDEYMLIFNPNKELQGYDFTASKPFDSSRYNEDRVYIYDPNYNNILWFFVRIDGKVKRLPSPIYPKVDGAFEVNKNIPDFFSGRAILQPNTYLLSIYIGEKCKEKLAEQEKKDEDDKIARQKRIEAQEKAEIRKKLLARQKKRDLEKQVRQELIDNGELFGEQHKRPPIPKEVADAVYRRDGGKCVYCGATENLQFDHIIPFSRGGATNIENLQLLCQKCNLQKSNKIG